MRSVLSLYSPKFPTIIVYMLQSAEYEVVPYIKWAWRTNDFTKVMRRRSLEKTKAANMLLAALRFGMLLQILLGIGLIWLWSGQGVLSVWLGVLVIVSYPIVWSHLITVPLLLGKVLVIDPRNKKLIKQSAEIFYSHPGYKIAVAGSYGKTTMKELLGVVLAEGKNVAITPANKNVASSHAVFASQLTGQEDVLVIEYGEGKPGDVAKFAATTQPNMGIITGIAPAHLDHYPSLEAVAGDIFSLANYLDDKDVYVNGESVLAKKHIKKEHILYSSNKVNGWNISSINISINKTSFVMKKGKKTLNLTSGLVGRHQVGPLAAVASIADALGLSKEQIEQGIGKTRPFDHRMQPREVNGAWIIDDTYNGNIDGIRAGLGLLAELDARRKTYVTPGLVDQGEETKSVHIQMGELIADAHPDRVVLMRNSVTDYILKGLKAGEYSGELVIENDPLEFYTNIDKFLASGDLVLMQNDWTDNYN